MSPGRLGQGLATKEDRGGGDHGHFQDMSHDEVMVRSFLTVSRIFYIN
jgi:hypothetical protein